MKTGLLIDSTAAFGGVTVIVSILLHTQAKESIASLFEDRFYHLKRYFSATPSPGFKYGMT